MTGGLSPASSELASASLPGPGVASATDPLAALRGLHLPEAVGVWPLAPGWWLVLAVVAGGLVGVWAFARLRRASLAHHALAEVGRLDADSTDLQALASALSEVLRRVALLRFGRERVASLHGDSWQEFLFATCPRAKRARRSLDPSAVRLLALAPYAPPTQWEEESAGNPNTREGVLAVSRSWIRWNA